MVFNRFIFLVGVGPIATARIALHDAVNAELLE